MKIFSGNAHRALADAICEALEVPLGAAAVGTFKNGETRVKIEEHVRGLDVFVVQPTVEPVDHHLMELLIMIDALRRASAARITAVMPYCGYARQEKKLTGREPITAKLVANLIATAGAHRLVALDLHSPAIQGFFDIPVDHLSAVPILARHARQQDEEEAVVVSPDSGGANRANEFRHRAMIPNLAIIAKHRPEPDVAEIVEMVGHVAGKTAIIVDDIIATASTLAEAANLLLDRGARRVIAYATHGEFAGNAVETIERSAIERVIVTDSMPSYRAGRVDKIEVLGIAPLLSQAIRRIHDGESVSSLFPPLPFADGASSQDAGLLGLLAGSTAGESVKNLAEPGQNRARK